jgi:hypothetical protein
LQTLSLLDLSYNSPVRNRFAEIFILEERILVRRRTSNLDAYLEEELYDTLIYCIQNPKVDDFENKRKRVEEIGVRTCIRVSGFASNLTSS